MRMKAFSSSMSADDSASRSTRSACGPTIIVQPEMGGHRYNYVRIMLKSLRHSNSPAILATTEAGLKEYRLKAKDALDDIHVTVLPTRALAVDTLRCIAKQWSPGLMVVPDGDSLLARVSLAWCDRDPLLRLLIMRPHLRSSIGKRSLKGIFKRILIIITNLKPNVDVVRLQSGTRRPDAPARWVSDPIEFFRNPATVDNLRERHSITESTTWFLVAGRINARKNIPTVIKALEQAQRRSGRRLGLILAGAVEPETMKSLDDAQWAGDLIVDDRHLREDELDSYITLSHASIIAHSSEAPSGILGKTVASGGIVVTAGARSLQRDCEDLGANALWTPLTVQLLSESICASLTFTKTPGRDIGTDQFCDAMLRPSKRAHSMARLRLADRSSQDRAGF